MEKMFDLEDKYNLEYREDKGLFRFVKQSKRDKDNLPYYPICYNLSDDIGNDFIDLYNEVTKDFIVDTHDRVCFLFGEYMIHRKLAKGLLYVECIGDKSFFDAKNIVEIKTIIN